MVDTYCGGDEMPPIPDEICECRECFRALDGKVALYSTSGDSTDIKGFFPAEFSKYPWTKKTTLYLGYHDGHLRRTDE